MERVRKSPNTTKSCKKNKVHLGCDSDYEVKVVAMVAAVAVIFGDGVIINCPKATAAFQVDSF